MKKIAQYLISFFVAVMLFTTLSIFTFAMGEQKNISVIYRDITLQINGKQVFSPEPHFIYNGSTFVPLRFLAESLHKKVEWFPAESKITIQDTFQKQALGYFYRWWDLLFILMGALIGCLVAALFMRKRKKPISHVSNGKVFVDVETTGIRFGEDEIVEIGALKVNPKSNHQESFQVFIKTTKKMTPSSVSINGITQKMIDEQGIPLKDALQRFIYFIGDLPLVAYNAPFDLGFLKRAARKYDFLFSNVGSSVLKMTRRAFPGLPSYRLGDVANSLNIQHVGYHRALTDCMLAKNVYDLCEKKLQSIQNSEGVKDGRLL